MSNDKKPKKAKPPIIHGAINRGRETTPKLVVSPIPALPAGTKKKN